MCGPSIPRHLVVDFVMRHGVLQDGANLADIADSPSQISNSVTVTLPGEIDTPTPFWDVVSMINGIGVPDANGTMDFDGGPLMVDGWGFARQNKILMSDPEIRFFLETDREDPDIAEAPEEYTEEEYARFVQRNDDRVPGWYDRHYRWGKHRPGVRPVEVSETEAHEYDTKRAAERARRRAAIVGAAVKGHTVEMPAIDPAVIRRARQALRDEAVESVTVELA
jgi:hypothetical protein